MRWLLLCATLLLCEMSASAAGDASTDSQGFSDWVTFNRVSPPWDCKGKCAAAIYGGPYLLTPLGNVDGARGFVPPWKYKYDDSAFVGGTLSQVFVEFKQFAQIEGEVGVGRRFGILHETEVWAALYFRWKWFPWNEFITTTLAVSTGVNYASGLPQYEVDMSGVGYGSRLLHYFSPEITFALPSRPDWQFLTRVHHRSGGEHYWGYTPLFKGVDGGTQYLVFGIRHWF